MDSIQLWSITTTALSSFAYPLLLGRACLGLYMLMSLYSIKPDLIHVGQPRTWAEWIHVPLSTYGDVHLKFDVLILNLSTKSPTELN